MYTGLPRTVLLVDPNHQRLCVTRIARKELQLPHEFMHLLDVCDQDIIGTRASQRA